MIIETIDVTPAAPQGPRGGARLLGSSLLLVRRRAWRDRGPLVASIVIVALASMLALAGPRLVLDTLDDGARDAIDAIGDDADIVVTFPVGNVTGDNVNSIRGTSPEGFAGYAEGASRNLPGVISPIVEGYTGYVLSRQQSVVSVIEPGQDVDTHDYEAIKPSDHPELWDSRLSTVVQFAMSNDVEWTLVEGRLPVDATAPSESNTPGENQYPGTGSDYEIIEVAITESVASALEVELGSVLQVQNIAQSRVYILIVGIVEASNPGDPAWASMPEALQGLTIDTPGRPVYRRGTIVVSTSTASALASGFEQPFDGTVILHVGSEGLTLQGAKDIASTLKTLEGTANTIIPAPDVSVQMTSGLGPALEAYPYRAKAALAQMSVTVAGVIAVAAVVVALMARLLLSRRESDIALERARGASVASIAGRLAIESVAFTVVGVTVGYVGAAAITGGSSFGAGLLILVVLVSSTALPILGVITARRLWTSRRIPANRRDRARIARAKAAKRLTLETLAVVLAIASVVTLRGRGVLQMRTSGVDPFLAAAPILLALGVTVIVLRLYPIPMALVQVLAKRTRGVAGIITLAKARGRIAALPLLSLSLAVSIAVSGGLLVSTIRNGQDQASWERVGGEVRIESGLDDTAVASLEADGLTVSRIVSMPFISVGIGQTNTRVHVLAVDEDYVEMIESIGLVVPDDLRALIEAGEDTSPGDDLPALLSASYRVFDFTDTREVYIGSHYNDFTVIGDAVSVPNGWAEGPFLILPVDALLAREHDAPIEYNLTFVAGDGAEEAVLALGIDPSSVSSRAGWLEGVRDSALIGGVALVMATAVVTVGILAAIGLLVTVLEGVRQRGLALSMFRTQGMSSRYGWWLALTELAPLALAAVAGGTAAGLAILVLLGETLGLEILAGGVSTPPLQADTGFLLAVATGVLALLFTAVAAEVAAHRRDKLSEVLRLGDTR
ncbi:MAG: hypothetical protein JW722_03165 [Demequinaceae bacterium]|nr:hypothetical protein [Demequinaceae bacterium]